MGKQKNNEPEESLTFTGTIKSIVWYSPESSWGVVNVATKVELPYAKKDLDYDMTTNKTEENYLISIVGKMPDPHIGDTYTIEGTHSFSEKYKKHQYNVVSISPLRPKSPEEQKLFLRAILTEKQTETLVTVYPNIVEEIIAGTDNVDLETLKGIGDYTWNRIKEKIVSNFAISDVLELLIPLGISFSKVQKLLEGEKNPQVLRDKIISNPYVITNINGISFKTADKIATQLNPNLKESEKRLIAFIKHHLKEVGEGAGHTHVTIDEIRNGIIDNVPEVEKFLDKFIEKETEKNKVLHIDGNKIALKYLYEAENFIFDALVELDKSKPLDITTEQIEAGIKKSEEELGFTFTEEQRRIVHEISSKNFSLLTGLAGTGKSTLSRAIVNAYSLAGYSIGIAALSAKAAIRAQETTGFEAKTLHRMLGATGKDGSFDFNEHNKLKFRVVLIDESSMLNAILFKALLAAVDTRKTKVIFVGDRGQLPPISAGNIFSDLFDVEYGFNRYELTKIQRQAEGSAIIVDGNKIRGGVDPVGKKESRIVHGNSNDLIYMFRSDRESLFNVAISSYLKSVSEKGLENVVLLTPRKKDTLNSTQELNKAIQNKINEVNAENKFIYGKKEFRLADKVIHTNNDYEKVVFNGEMGYVIKVEDKFIEVEYPDKVIRYDHENIGDLELAYSMSVHKAQGSQFQDVIVILDNSHFMLLSNQLMYTAITRAQTRCLLLAEPFAFDKSLEENKNIRNTWLKQGFPVKEFIDEPEPESKPEFVDDLF